MKDAKEIAREIAGRAADENSRHGYDPHRWETLVAAAIEAARVEGAKERAGDLRAALLPADARERIARVLRGTGSHSAEPFDDLAPWLRDADAVLAALRGEGA